MISFEGLWPRPQSYYSANMADKNGVNEVDIEDKKRAVDLSRVKNKLRRSVLYKQEKHNKNKEKRERKKKRKREEEELGDEVSQSLSANERLRVEDRVSVSRQSASQFKCFNFQATFQTGGRLRKRVCVHMREWNDLLLGRSLGH